MDIIQTLYIYIHLFLYDSQQKTYDDKIHLSVIVIHRSGDAEECLNNIRGRQIYLLISFHPITQIIPTNINIVICNEANIALCHPLSQSRLRLQKMESEAEKKVGKDSPNQSENLFSTLVFPLIIYQLALKLKVIYNRPHQNIQQFDGKFD